MTTLFRRKSSSGSTGIYRDKRYWQARIIRDGKPVYQANFATKEAAIAAREAKCLELFGPPVALPLPVPGACWVPLTGGKFALVDAADFPRVSQLEWFFTQGYAKAKDPTGRRRKITLDRFILELSEELEPDHVNRDPLDCRRENLRPSTHAENMRNRGMNRNNTSGFRGVTWHRRRKKWFAQASIGRKCVGLGYFTSAEDAARARDAWIRENHGSFASFNFPDPGDSPQKSGDKSPESFQDMEATTSRPT